MKRRGIASKSLFLLLTFVVVLAISCVLFAGCKGSSSPSSPSPSNSPTILVSYNGLQITFSTTSSATTWDWDFGDGSAHDFTQNPIHVYPAEGSYTVQLTTDGSSIGKLTISVYANYYLRPIVPTLANPGDRGGYCAPFNKDGTISAVLSITPPGNIDMYVCILNEGVGCGIKEGSIISFVDSSLVTGNWNVSGGATWCVKIRNNGPNPITYSGEIRFICPYSCGAVFGR